MICPACQKTKVKVTHTYSGVPGKVAQRGWCPGCGTTYTVACTVMHVDPRRGQGAQSVAKRWLKGPVKPEDPDQAESVPQTSPTSAGSTT